MRKAFTLVEIMITVMIIGILLMIAIPGWMRIRQNAREATCRDNSRIIDNAKVQWALDKQKLNSDIPTFPDLNPDYISGDPECPEGGTYTIGDSNTKTSCSIHGSY